TRFDTVMYTAPKKIPAERIVALVFHLPILALFNETIRTCGPAANWNDATLQPKAAHRLPSRHRPLHPPRNMGNGHGSTHVITGDNVDDRLHNRKIRITCGHGFMVDPIHSIPYFRHRFDPIDADKNPVQAA